jgi:hypothetical protein
MRRNMSARMRRLGAPEKCLYDARRWRIVCFGGAARKAMEKSREEEGEHGVTMMAGSGDFSVARGKDRSRGAGIRA